MTSSTDMVKQLETMYVETGTTLPDVVARRFEEVANSHSSIVYSRRLYFESERISVLDRLRATGAGHRALDRRRADVMNLLSGSMAFETFYNAERGLVEVDSIVVGLE